MKTFLTAVALTLLALVGLTGAESKVEVEVVEPIVSISTQEGRLIGTGTYLAGDEHLFFTAAHVAAFAFKPDKDEEEKQRTDPNFKSKPKAMSLKFSNGLTVQAELVSYSASWNQGGTDLALFKAKKSVKGIRGAEITAEDPEVGEDLFYCGMGGGLDYSLEKSIVNRVTDRYIRTNGIGWYGHSGSGVFLKRQGKWKLAATLVAFEQVPNDNPRSPMLCERQLSKFLSDYRESMKKSTGSTAVTPGQAAPDPFNWILPWLLDEVRKP